MLESSKVSINLLELGLRRSFHHDYFLVFDPDINQQHDKHCFHPVMSPKLDSDWQKASFNCE